MLDPTTADQRKEFYEDVESLLNPGFLSHNITVGKTRLALRTLGPGDLFLLKTRAHGLPEKDWQQWAIASSVWMVDGVCLLEDPNLVPRMYQMVKHLPVRVHRLLYSTVLGLFSRSEKAVESVEAYIYEDFSRSSWRRMGKENFVDRLGVPGAKSLGVNFIQQIWTAFNQVEDERAISDRQWDGFKLVASTHSPKGVQKIDKKDQQRSREEKSRRQSVMDRFYYYRIGKVDKEGYLKDKNRDLEGVVIQQTKTADQLSEEMRRWVQGDKDQHDMIVDQYKNQILARREAEEREREARRAALHQEIERREDAGFEPMPLVAYSPEQIQELLHQRDAGQRGRRIYDGQQAKTERFVNNFLDKQQQKGSLKETRDGKLADPDARAVERHASLAEALEDRQVGFGSAEPSQYDEGEADLEDLINPEVFGGQPGGSR